jgi:predicted HTH domain antitoxin
MELFISDIREETASFTEASRFMNVTLSAGKKVLKFYWL